MMALLCDSLHVEHPVDAPEDMQSSPSASGQPSHGFSVWRIVQSMPDATPQQLDSAIQANLPEREKFRSERPDTLEIPGLPARKTLSKTEEFPICYRMGYFQNDPLLHLEINTPLAGVSTNPIPYQIWRDDWITVFVLACMLFFLFIFKDAKRRFTHQLKEFFFPSRNSTNMEAEGNAIEKNMPLLMITLLCLVGGLGTFIYIQDKMLLFLAPLSPYILIGLSVLTWVVYFFCKAALYSFVNWIFFYKQDIKKWNRSVAFLVSAETLLFFPVVMITVYFGADTDAGCWTMIFIALFVKLLLFIKSYQIFFKKIYGTLHLIVYFCTLELMPLLVILKVLVNLAECLTVKF